MKPTIEIPMVLKNKGVEMASVKKYNDALEISWGIHHLFKRYRSNIKKAHRKRLRLKNPINHRTGKSLKTSTLKAYQSSLPSDEKHIKVSKGAIQLLVFEGYCGSQKTRARWVQESLLEKSADVRLPRDLTDEEKKFILVYSGNPTVAARQVYRGNFVTIKHTGWQQINNQKIRAAIRAHREVKLSRLGCRVVDGGGDSSGYSFKIAPEKNPKGNVVRLLYFKQSTLRRFRARRNRLKEHARGLMQRGQFHSGSKLTVSCIELYEKIDSLSGLDRDAYDRVHDELTTLEKKHGLLRWNYKGY